MLCLDTKISASKEIKNFSQRTEKELDKFFGVKLDSVWIMLLNSRRDIDAVYGKKTPDWLVGFTHKNTIFILNPKVYTKESSHKSIKDFWKTLKHEYCHLYNRKITGNTCPSWLNEGLACYLANQKRSKPGLREALNILDYKTQGKYDIYKVGYFWVNLLAKKFGPRKVLILIRAFKPQMTRTEFGEIFYRIFKIKFEQKSLASLYNSYNKH